MGFLTAALLLAVFGFWWARAQSKQSAALRSATREFYSDFYSGRPLLVCAASRAELNQLRKELDIEARAFERPFLESNHSGANSPWSDRGYASITFEGRTVPGANIVLPLVKESGHWLVCPEGASGILPTAYPIQE